MTSRTATHKEARMQNTYIDYTPATVGQPRHVRQTIIEEWRRMHALRRRVERQRRIDRATDIISTLAGLTVVFGISAALFWALLGAL